jgi:hypothetical protein
MFLKKLCSKIIAFMVLFIIIPFFIYIVILKFYFHPIKGIASKYPFYNTKFKESFAFKKYEEVEIGMKLDKIEGLIGAPYEYYNSKKFSNDLDSFNFAANYSKEKHRYFYNFNWCLINLYFDKDSILLHKSMSWWDE